MKLSRGRGSDGRLGVQALNSGKSLDSSEAFPGS